MAEANDVYGSIMGDCKGYAACHRRNSGNLWGVPDRVIKMIE